MDLTVFSIWKFRYVEGFLQDMHSYDVLTTKYVNPRNFMTTWLKYDIKAETVSIEKDGTVPIVCKFSELTDTLKKLDMYKERPITDRHFLAGPQDNPETTPVV